MTRHEQIAELSAFLRRQAVSTDQIDAVIDLVIDAFGFPLLRGESYIDAAQALTFAGRQEARIFKAAAVRYGELTDPEFIGGGGGAG